MDPIAIPAGSFTASRFLYGDASEVAAASAVVLLGGVPAVWHREQRHRLARTYAQDRLASTRSDALYSHRKHHEDREEGKLQALLKRYYDAGHDNDNDDDDDDDDSSNHEETDLDSELDDYEEAPDDDEQEVSSLDSEPSRVHSWMHRLVTHKRTAREETSRDPLPYPKLDPPQIIESRAPELEDPFWPDDHVAEGSSLQQTPSQTSQVPTEHTSTGSFYTALEIPNDTASHTSVRQSSDSPNLSQAPVSADTMRLNLVETMRAPHLANTTSSSSNGAASPISALSTNLTVKPANKVRFHDTNKSKNAYRGILRLKPTPEAHVEPEELVQRDRYDSSYGKVKFIASNTKQHIKMDLKMDMNKYNRRKWFKVFMRNFEPGEIIKYEKMLVLVKVSDHVASKYRAFTENEPYDTRVRERWKEYIVVARSTGDSREPIALQFYTTRNIPERHDSKHAEDALEIRLTKRCSVNFYSPLDRTIALAKGKDICILRCQTPSSSIHWLTFFNSVLGIETPSVLRVEIPIVNLSMDLNLNREFYKQFLKSSTEHIKLIYKDHGYHLEGLRAVEYLSTKIKKRLVEAGYETYVKSFEGNENMLGFCWRYYDRLEWLFGETLVNLFWEQAMHQTHELELRVIKHYPRTVELESVKLTEPPPVEGFVVRLTTKEGHLKGGLFHKQVFSFDYLFTSENNLFLTKAYRSSPPLPYSEVLMAGPTEHSALQALDKIRESLPSVYYHNPFMLNSSGHYNWLHPGISAEEFKKRDFFAFSEFQRRVMLVTKASKVINMLDVAHVRNFDPKKLPPTVEAASALFWGSVSKESIFGMSKSDTYFEIVMKNGTSMVLKAPNPLVRNEWVSRLRSLIEYWINRINCDNQILYEMKKKNIEGLNIDDITEANVSEIDSQWEITRGIANTSVYNITSASMFRPVIRSGLLYQKPKKHATFKRYHVILVPGRIVLYKVYARDLLGSIKPTTHHSKYLDVPLKDCYVYSGPICQLDLLDHTTEDLGKNLLPRVYEDGWISSEDDAVRCFTLWFGKKRAISGKAKNKLHEDKNPSLLSMASRLGVTGRSMVFLCRSRQERDLWVTALHTELERFGMANLNQTA